MLRAAFENEFSLATSEEGALRAGRLRALLLDDRDDRVAGLRRRAGRRRSTRSGSRSSSTTPSSATASRRSRPRTRRAAGRRRAAARARDDPRRRGAAGTRRLAGAEAVARRTPATAATCTSRSGRASATGSTTRGATGSRPLAPRSSPACSSTFPGLCGLTAPSFNSYQPDRARSSGRARSSAGASTTARRRSASPSTFRGAEEASTNAELKACDASCNPYLALGGLIAAGLDGIERGLDRPSRSTSIRRRSPSERGRRGIARLPATQAEALDALAGRRGPARRARARSSPTPTSPSAAPSGRPTPRETRHSSSRVTSRSTERDRARRPSRARDPARAPATLDEFRGLFSESDDPRQWPHVATGVTYRRAVRLLAEHFGVEPDECAVFEHRLASDPAEYARVAAAGDEHRAAADRRRLPAAGIGNPGTSWGSSPAACAPGAAARDAGARAAGGDGDRTRAWLRRAEDDRRLPRRSRPRVRRRRRRARGERGDERSAAGAGPLRLRRLRPAPAAAPTPAS